MLVGINPEEASKVIPFGDKITSGKSLSGDNLREILIGDSLAQLLGVDLNDKVIVMTQDKDGLLTGAPYRVRGLFHFGAAQMDKNMAFVHLGSAQELLGIGNNVSEIMIRLKDKKFIPSFTADAKQQFPASTYEVLVWEEILPEFTAWPDWYYAVLQIIMLVASLVVAIGILNTFLMSIFERTKEFGVMLAVGTRPRVIVQLILLESFLLQIAGIFVGLMLGMMLVQFFGQIGISLEYMREALETQFLTTTVYPSLNSDRALKSIITLVCVISVIIVLPAWRASRMEPVKAIYHS